MPVFSAVIPPASLPAPPSLDERSSADRGCAARSFAFSRRQPCSAIRSDAQRPQCRDQRFKLALVGFACNGYRRSCATRQLARVATLASTCIPRSAGARRCAAAGLWLDLLASPNTKRGSGASKSARPAACAPYAAGGNIDQRHTCRPASQCGPRLGRPSNSAACASCMLSRACSASPRGRSGPPSACHARNLHVGDQPDVDSGFSEHSSSDSAGAPSAARDAKYTSAALAHASAAPCLRARVAHFRGRRRVGMFRPGVPHRRPRRNRAHPRHRSVTSATSADRPGACFCGID